MCKLVLQHRFHIDTAQNGAEALAAVCHQGPYTIVISDMHMPEMTGIELLRRVREISPDSIRMILTGDADVRTAAKAVNEGSIFRFLTKPCQPDTLIKAVNA